MLTILQVRTHRSGAVRQDPAAAVTTRIRTTKVGVGRSRSTTQERLVTP